jgi:NHLM bacteriocin system ABC transporter peptidase/ATP-binding protein
VRINDPAVGRRHVSAAELDESMTGVVLALTPGPDFQRGGERTRVFTALRERLAGGEARLGLALVFLVSFFLVVPGILSPVFSRLFVDRVLLSREPAWLGPLLAAMGAAAVLLGVLAWVQRSLLLRFETRLAVDGSGRFFWHLLHLPVEFFHQRFTGDLSARVPLNDRLAELLSRDVAVNALNLILAVFFAAMMAVYDPVLACASVLVVSINVVVLRMVSRRRADSNGRLLREGAKLNGTALWGLDMIETLKATGSESELFARWAGQQARVLNVRQELARANLPIATLPQLLVALNAALVLGLGGLRVMEGRLSLGDLVAFQILAVAFMAPVTRLVGLGARLQIAEGEVGRLEDVLRADRAVLPAPRNAPADEAPLSGRLELRGVTFSYAPLDPPVVRGLDLVVEPGRTVALVGRTGSGKSTVARLVAGLYEPSAGEVLFDGHAWRDLPRRKWTRSVAVVDQDIFVFEGTVLDNLTLWNGEIPLDDVVAAARDACILDEIEARPGGFGARVDEGGVNWSTGQLQRLEIARALAGNPTLLVLDEATSSLDPETEARIVANLRRRGCTCLVIAHRLSTVRDADEIVVLHDGQVEQRGAHAALMRSAGPYSRLIVHE